MPGKLDEISQAIGSLQNQSSTVTAWLSRIQNSVDDIKADIQDNRRVQAERHAENQRASDAQAREIASLRTAANRAALTLSRRQLAAATAAFTGVVAFCAWLVEAMIGMAAAWIKTHWH